MNRHEDVATTCDCGHPQGWHRKNVGACIECGCTYFDDRDDAAVDSLCRYPMPERQEARSAATTESREDRDERWRDWMERSMQFCPLNLYDETRKLGEYAFCEMLTRIHELEAEPNV